MDNFDNKPFNNNQHSETGFNLRNLPTNSEKFINRTLENDGNQFHADSFSGMIRNEFKDRSIFSGNKPDSFLQNTERNQRDDYYRDQTSFREHAANNMSNTNSSVDYPLRSSSYHDNKPMPSDYGAPLRDLKSSDFGTRSNSGVYSTVPPPPRNDNMQLDGNDYFDRPGPAPLMTDNFKGSFGNYNSSSYSKQQDHGDNLSYRSNGNQMSNNPTFLSSTGNYSSYTSY